MRALKLSCWARKRAKSNTIYFRQAMFLRKLDIALGNRALREHPTDYLLI